MSNYNFNGIIDAMSKASPSHLALVSFIVFPAVLHYWLEVLTGFFPEILFCWKLVALIFLVLLYLGCLLWLIRENQRRLKLETQKNIIMGRLTANGWKSMSYDSARKVLGDDFSDDQFITVIHAFPDTLRSVRVKGGIVDEQQTYKPGIGRFNYHTD